MRTNFHFFLFSNFCQLCHSQFKAGTGCAGPNQGKLRLTGLDVISFKCSLFMAASSIAAVVMGAEYKLLLHAGSMKDCGLSIFSSIPPCIDSTTY